MNFKLYAASWFMLNFLLVTIACSKSDCDSTNDNPVSIQQQEICVSTPGSLESLLKDNKLTITHLTVSGTLNGDDLLTLREMAGSDYNFAQTSGVLEYLDLSRCTFTSGGKLNTRASQLPYAAFAYCNKLQTIFIPESITELDDYCFYHCSSLFEFLPSGEITSIGRYCFYECPNLLLIPNTEAIHELGKGCFAYSSLSQFKFGKSLKEIPYGAFYETPLSGDIDLSHIRVIDSLAFQHTNLTSVRFSENLERIERQAFKGKNYVLNPGRTLKQDLILPKSLKFLGEDAFSCTGVKSITIQSDLEMPEDILSNTLSNGFFYRCDKLKKLIISEGVKKLELTFKSCDALEEVILPNSLETIGIGSVDDYFTPIYPGTFQFCSSLKSIDLPESLRIIGDYVFSNSGLTHINIPDNVQYIGSYCFSGCSYLEQVHLPNALIMIHSGAFNECSSLKSIDIPSTVKYISYNAFGDCTSLEHVVLPKALTIHPDVDKSVIGAVPSIESTLFKNCSNLLDVDMSECENIVSISLEAFSGCSRLRSVSLPPNLKEISSSAFVNCISLKDIVLPQTLTKIEDYSFSRCGSLQSIEFPAGLQHLGKYAFDNCRDIISISLGEQIEYIGQYCFNDCIHLETVFCHRDDPLEIDSTVFANNILMKKGFLYVPASSVDSYKNATVWKDFGSISPIM